MDNSNEENGNIIKKNEEISDLEFIKRKQIDDDFKQISNLLEDGYQSM